VSPYRSSISSGSRLAIVVFMYSSVSWEMPWVVKSPGVEVVSPRHSSTASSLVQSRPRNPASSMTWMGSAWGGKTQTYQRADIFAKLELKSVARSQQTERYCRVSGSRQTGVSCTPRRVIVTPLLSRWHPHESYKRW